jgi:hypothetical protein
MWPGLHEAIQQARQWAVSHSSSQQQDVIRRSTTKGMRQKQSKVNKQVENERVLTKVRN